MDEIIKRGYIDCDNFISRIKNINTKNEILEIFKQHIYEHKHYSYIRESKNIFSVLCSANSIEQLIEYIEILLKLKVEHYWYEGYPKYINSHDVFNDSDLINLADIKNKMHFSFKIENSHLVNRVINFVRRKSLFQYYNPSYGTVGMKFTKCKPAMFELLNELGRKVHEQGIVETKLKLQVNSITRTMEHQECLIKLGYFTLIESSHIVGFAADIERLWYKYYKKDMYFKIEQVLKEYSEQGILNVIDEDTVWHICLNPSFIDYYDQSFKNNNIFKERK